VRFAIRRRKRRTNENAAPKGGVFFEPLKTQLQIRDVMNVSSGPVEPAL
jgi:hypothetical protein